jgi:hypothetical protein
MRGWIALGDAAAPSDADIPARALLDASDQPEKDEEYDRADDLSDNRSDQSVNSDAQQPEQPAADQRAVGPYQAIPAAWSSSS